MAAWLQPRQQNKHVARAAAADRPAGSPGRCRRCYRSPPRCNPRSACPPNISRTCSRATRARGTSRDPAAGARDSARGAPRASARSIFAAAFSPLRRLVYHIVARYRVRVTFGRVDESARRPREFLGPLNISRGGLPLQLLHGPARDERASCCAHGTWDTELDITSCNNTNINN